jgi:hypothetical protein
MAMFQVYSQQKREMATIKADPTFSPKKVAETLRKAMKGWGTNEIAVIGALTSITNAQRQEVCSQYKKMYGLDLNEELDDELTRNLGKVVRALMMPSDLYIAHEMRRAMKGAGTNEDCLIECLASRSNREIADLKATYKRDLGRDLDDDLLDETSGDFKELIGLWANGYRDESLETDSDQANTAAQALIQAGPRSWGTDESIFVGIFGKLGFAQLSLIFEEYKKISGGVSIESAIRSELSGALEDGMLAIVKCAQNKIDYFASRLHAAMKGIIGHGTGTGTDDSTLIRIIVSRSEEDLDDIKEAFERLYGKPLAQWVNQDCHGDYGRILLALLK